MILIKLVLKFDPVASVTGDSFNGHTFFGINNNVTPLCTGTAHLALNLGIVSMGSFKFAHVVNVFKIFQLQLACI